MHALLNPDGTVKTLYARAPADAEGLVELSVDDPRVFAFMNRDDVDARTAAALRAADAGRYDVHQALVGDRTREATLRYVAGLDPASSELADAAAAFGKRPAEMALYASALTRAVTDVGLARARLDVAAHLPGDAAPAFTKYWTTLAAVCRACGVNVPRVDGALS